MARNVLSYVGWGGLVAWALAGSAGVLVLRGQGEEQARRLEVLERSVAELRQSRGAAEPARVTLAQPAPEGARDSGEARSPGLSEQELEALALRVAELLEGARGPGANGAGGTSEPRVTRNPEQQAALHRANERVEHVLARGRLSPEDVLGLRREMAPFEGTAEAEALRKRLAVALNQGRLIPDNPREPLLP
ncbi:hypothetical protein NR798_28140 [Archangium gephyra]|uniref:hypothetical protein n=1 Tax=Archangium gephyra TaxID=48 RepID=UPI0035D4F4B4